MSDTELAVNPAADALKAKQQAWLEDRVIEILAAAQDRAHDVADIVARLSLALAVVTRVLGDRVTEKRAAADGVKAYREVAGATVKGVVMALQGWDPGFNTPMYSPRVDELVTQLYSGINTTKEGGPGHPEWIPPEEQRS